MPIRKLLPLFFLYISLISILWAGDQKGNGADFVACPDKTILYDFYENPMNEFSWEGSEVDLVVAIAEKNYHYSPQIFKKIINYARSFYSESRFVNGEIGPIYDSGEDSARIPDNCHYVQGVLQKHVVFGNEKKYLINHGHWDQLSTFHKAGVILHELLYRELNSENSKRLRYFNSWLFSQFNSVMSDKDFYKQYKSSGFPYIYIFDLPMSAQKLILDDGPIRSLVSFPNKPFSIFGKEVTSKEHVVDVYSNGRPRSMQFSGEIYFENSSYFFKVCSNQTNCKVTFSANGTPEILNQVTMIDKITKVTTSKKAIRLSETGEVNEVL